MSRRRDNTRTADQTLLFIADNWGRDRTPTDPTTILATLATASADSWAEINPNHPTEPTRRTPYPAGTSELAADAVLAGMFQAYRTRDELAATITAPHRTPTMPPISPPRSTRPPAALRSPARPKWGNG